MKQFLLAALLLLTLGVLSSCKDRPAPVLPDRSTVSRVEVTMDEESLTHLKREWIDEVVAGLAAAAPTRLKSVNDAPDAPSYTQVTFHHDDSGESRLFLYEQDGTYYMEQPYQGIWQIDPQLYHIICSTP